MSFPDEAEIDSGRNLIRASSPINPPEDLDIDFNKVLVHPPFARHFLEVPPSFPSFHDPLLIPISNSGIRIVTQPDAIQVTDYNIRPEIEIEFEQAPNVPITIQAFLMHNNSEVPYGFTGGEVAVLKSGQTRVSFPSLHLNKMTPIKKVKPEKGKFFEKFTIKFVIGNISFFSNPFELSSTRKKEQKIPKSPKQQKALIGVKIRGEETPRGSIALARNSMLEKARNQIAKSPDFPKNYRFWVEKMNTIVQYQQEDSIKIEVALEDSFLILQLYDAALHGVDDEVLNTLFCNMDADQFIPISKIIETLFKIYDPKTPQKLDISIIGGGITHFLDNISKVRRQSGKVNIEDFQLFLKYFGPARECLRNVFNVYKEPYFHGFARHSDATEALRGKPGYFLVRFSESQLKDGYFAFNINKVTNDFREKIENYSLPYDSSVQSFIFNGKLYRTLNELITDPSCSHVFQKGLAKTVEKMRIFNYDPETLFLGMEGEQNSDIQIIDS